MWIDNWLVVDDVGFNFLVQGKEQEKFEVRNSHLKVEIFNYTYQKRNREREWNVHNTNHIIDHGLCIPEK